nr:hypothetical protein [Tanacetum cinerariifolium]
MGAMRFPRSDLRNELRLVMLSLLRARAGGAENGIPGAKMASKLPNSWEPARPTNTNKAPVVHLHAYLFAAKFVSSFDNVPEYSELIQNL